MDKPTHEDAMLLLHFAQWPGMPEAVDYIWSEDFIADYAEFVKKYPFGSEERLKVGKACGYFELLGLYYKHGLLNGELIFDWFAIDTVWDKVKDYVHGLRQETGDRRLFEHFEALAMADAEWEAGKR